MARVEVKQIMDSEVLLSFYSSGREWNTLLDLEDFEQLGIDKLSIKHNGGNKYYAVFKRRTLHSLLLNTPKGMHTDHINGNSLDNRRCNLRICTPSENLKNIPSKNPLGKGIRVTYNNKYQVIFCPHRGKATHIGIYETIEEATLARDAAIKTLHGDFTNV